MEIRIRLSFIICATLLTIGVGASGYEGSPLLQAVNAGDIDSAKSILDQGADIEQTNSSKTASALSIAVSNNDERMIRFLIERGANVNSTKLEMTPLAYASKPEIIRLMVSLGADVNLIHNNRVAFQQDMGCFAITETDAWTNTITYAELGADFSRYSRILSDCFGTRMDNDYDSGELGPACVTRELKFIRLLVTRGARPREAKGLIPKAARCKQNDKVVSYLLNEGAEIADALIYARDVSTIKILLKAGADIEVSNKIGLTPLLYAAQYCEYDKVRFLFTSKAKTNVTDSRGRGIWQLLAEPPPELSGYLSEPSKLAECKRVRTFLKGKVAQ